MFYVSSKRVNIGQSHTLHQRAFIPGFKSHSPRFLKESHHYSPIRKRKLLNAQGSGQSKRVLLGYQCDNHLFKMDYLHFCLETMRVPEIKNEKAQDYPQAMPGTQLQLWPIYADGKIYKGNQPGIYFMTVAQNNKIEVVKKKGIAYQKCTAKFGAAQNPSKGAPSSKKTVHPPGYEEAMRLREKLGRKENSNL